MIICENLLFSHGAKIENYTSGEFIFEEGTEPKYYMQIKSGTVKLASVLEDGREFIHGIPFDGHCIAETYIFNNKKYAINAITINDSEIIKLEKNKLKELLLKNPALIFNIYSYTADRMHYRYLTSASFSFKDPVTKLELVMNYMKNYFGFKEKYAYAVPYTRQQLASLTGLRTETVIRTIKKMEKLEIVKLNNSKIYF